MKISPAIRIYLVFIFLGITLWILCAVFHPFEPHYEGKRLSAWAKDMSFGLQPGNYGTNEPSLLEIREKYEKAVAAIQHIGVRALPIALKWCKAKDSWLKEKLEDWIDDWNEKHENFEIHITAATEKRVEGGNIIRALGPMAKPVVPDLMKMLESRDLDIAASAMNALQYAGDDAIPPLLEPLRNPNPDFRRRAVMVLGMMEPKASAAVPALLQCLDDEDESVRVHAVRSLGLIGENAPVVVPALMRRLDKETRNPMSLDFIWAFGHFGTNAKPAVPILIKIIESKQVIVADHALGALRKIDPEAAKPFIERRKAGITNAPPAISPTGVQEMQQQ